MSALMDKLPAQLSQAAAGANMDDKHISRIEGIINSMTPQNAASRNSSRPRANGVSLSERRAGDACQPIAQPVRTNPENDENVRQGGGMAR